MSRPLVYERYIFGLYSGLKQYLMTLSADKKISTLFFFPLGARCSQEFQWHHEEHVGE